MEKQFSETERQKNQSCLGHSYSKCIKLFARMWSFSFIHLRLKVWEKVNPVADNVCTEAGRKENRRVEVYMASRNDSAG